MRRALMSGLMLAAALMAPGRAAAWMIYTDRDDPAQWVVEIERAYGDVVKLSQLPQPHRSLIGPARATQPILYRWRYAREAEGLAFLAVDERGQGRIGFEFIIRRPPLDGQRLGAAAVLVGKDGRALHTFYARADTIGGAFAGGARHRHISLSAERAPDWWRQVEAIAFFTMRYYPQQELGDAEAWEAMRRAVGPVRRGQGTEQRG